MKEKEEKGLFQNSILGGDSFSLEERIFHGLTFFSALGWTLILVGNLLLQFEPVLILGNFAFAVSHYFFYYFSRFLRFTEYLHIPFAIYSFLALTFLWLTSGGVDGGAIYIFNMLLSIFVVIIRRKAVLMILIFSSLLLVFLIALEYYRPEWITKHGRLEDRLFDLGLSIIVSIVVINVLIYVTIRNYVNLNKKKETINQVLDETLTGIRKDLLLSRKIQMGMVSQKLSSNSNFSSWVKYIPLAEVGGDIYSIEETKEGNLQVFIADATGHGIQGALITMLIYSEYNHCKSIARSPSEVVKLLNDTIATKYRTLDIYFSCAVIEIFKEENKLVYTSGGHIEQFLLSSTGNIQLLAQTGNLVGFQKKSVFEEKTVTMNKEDTLLLFSDGIIDEFNSKGEEYGQVRFLQRILKSSYKNPNLIMEDCLEDVRKFLAFRNFQDDITLIGIQRR
jgi:serine phosphatase RsbU (regulator of sigma subunit)